MVSYPDYIDNAIPIIGTPRQMTYDLLLWQTELSVIESLYDHPQGDEQAMRIVLAIQAFGLMEPTICCDPDETRRLPNVSGSTRAKYRPHECPRLRMAIEGHARA